MTAASQTVERINGALKRVPVLPLYFIALVPGVWTFWQALNGGLGADPMRVLEHELGIWSLRFMLAALAVTPLMRRGGLRLLRFRRMLGLTVFFYALAHLTVYVVLDQQFQWGAIVRDILKRPYITFGMAAFVMLLPMAATSNNVSVKRLGAAAWRNVHRLAYPAGLLMVLHYLWLVKRWTGEPLAYAAIMIVLLALRLNFRRSGRGAREPGRARAVKAGSAVGARPQR